MRTCRQSGHFDVHHFFDLLSWLHNEMHAAQSSAQRLRTSTQEGSELVLASDTPEATSGQERARRLRAVRQHLYHCSALAERAVAAVAGCVKALEADIEGAAQQGGVRDEDRKLVQALLQRCAALMVRSG